MGKERSAVLSAIVAFPMSLIGLVAAIIWYRSLDSQAAEVMVGASSIGPMILGFFSGIMLLWSGGLILTGLLLVKKHIDEGHEVERDDEAGYSIR
ncbi:MAG: hypothetical protein WD877_01800 [Candidatus Saccharimonadales bacterium]